MNRVEDRRNHDEHQHRRDQQFGEAEASLVRAATYKALGHHPTRRDLIDHYGVAPDRIDYEARIDDPEVFTRPWTLAFPLRRDEEYRIYEYACHEGNKAVEGVLRGARYQERTEARPRQER